MMICNSNAEQNPNDYHTCMLNYCKVQAIVQDYKYFTYGTDYWCMLCDKNDDDGSIVDEGDMNINYDLYECQGNFYYHLCFYKLYMFFVERM